MDVVSVSPQSVTFANRQNVGGEAGFVQATPAASNSASSATDAAVVKEVPSSNQLAQAVRQANDAFAQKGINLYASFEKDKISGVEIVKIMEKKTNEVIRQLPPPEMVRFAQSLVLPAGWRGQ